MLPVLSFDTDHAASPVPLLRAGDRPAVRLDREAARGHLIPVRPGVYAPAALWRALPPWDRYLARVHAVALVLPHSVFCLESAAVLLRLPLIGEPSAVHVLSRDGTARESGGIRTHVTSDAREIVDAGGVLVTSRSEVAVDIARSRHPAVALAVADAVLRAEQATTLEQLVARNESRSSGRGRRRARWALHRADGHAATALESVSRAVVEWLGFPAPTLQHVMSTPLGDYALDMAWPRFGIAAETDGRVKYDGRYGDATDVVWAEKRREDELRRHLRGLARWGWPELQEPLSIRRILTSAGLQPVAPVRTDELFALRAALAGHQHS